MPTPVDDAQTSLQAFLFTDIVGSMDLKRRLGDVEGARLIAEHDTCFRECVTAFGGVEQDNAGDGFFATFPVPSIAVKCALAFQRALAGQRVEVRVGIHMGEAVHVAGAGDTPKLVGLAIDTAARVMSLAMPNQILITRHAFDSARQQVLRGPHDEPVLWLAHGAYHLKGLDEPIEVHEAGIEGTGPLRPPPDSEKARRAIAPGDEETLGWRPAVGFEIPGRSGWRIERKLGAGGFGEAWLAQSQRTKEQRAFKFCFQADRLRSLKRELTLFRVLKETLGERDDIARLYDVSLEAAPFFLEMEYTPDGSLDLWGAETDRLASMGPDERTLFVVEIAEALAAAHSVGVLHKDVKPSNVLVRRDAQGRPHARLTDFGIGQLLDRTALEAAQVSAAGFTETAALTDLGSRTGTRVYMAPELFVGRPASIVSDVYALGVVLYQMTVGDLNQPLGHGWERQIADPLLVEDIAGCVAGNPKERFASCDEVARRLRSLEARRLQKAEEERRTAAEARRARTLRLTTIAAAVLLVVAVAAFVVVGVLDQRRTEAEDARGEADKQRAEAERRFGIISRLMAAYHEELGDNPRARWSGVFLTGMQAALESGDPGDVFFFLEHARIDSLLSLIESHDQLATARLPKSLRVAEEAARAQVLEARRALDREMGSPQRSLKRARAARKELDAANERFLVASLQTQRLARAVAATSPALPATLQDLKKGLRPDQAYLAFAVLPERLVALVVTRSGARMVDLGPAGANDDAAEQFSVPQGDPTVAMAALHARLIVPLGLPRSVRQLLVSPEGRLLAVPFGLLVPDREVAFTPSASTYLSLLKSTTPRGRGVLAVGDPIYGSVRGRRLVPLPSTRTEAMAIGSIVLLGKDATERRLKAAFPRERLRGVHLAAHALMVADRPLLSSIALGADAAEDGLLTALEIAQLNIDADLVSLSACDTARGAILQGGGIGSLPRAFLYAGSPRVICALWKVDDAATLALMTRFYELWNPPGGKEALGAAAALREAQAFVRGHDKWKHPYYWAAWALWGLVD